MTCVGFLMHRRQTYAMAGIYKLAICCNISVILLARTMELLNSAPPFVIN